MRTISGGGGLMPGQLAQEGDPVSLSVLEDVRAVIESGLRGVSEDDPFRPALEEMSRLLTGVARRGRALSERAR